MRAPITLAVEGATDVVVAKRLLQEAGLEPGVEYVTNGKGALDQRLAGYNHAARFSCWLVLRDLDRDADCAPTLARRLLPKQATHMRLHVAVHAIESWLMADSEAISRYLSVTQASVPMSPDAIEDPKRALLELARRSTKRVVREAMLPSEGTSARVGPGFSSFMIEFATTRWRPPVAASKSESLERFRRFLESASDRSKGAR